MKSKCNNCDSDEFITKPIRYDIYKLFDGKLVFQSSEITNEEIELFCRGCSQKIEFDEEDLVV